MWFLNNKFDIVFDDINNIELNEILWDKNILFFYPKDNTPGCTNENIDFTSLKSEFDALGIKLIGVSKDSSESHLKFIKWKELKNPLISDPELILHKHYGAFGEKNNYWKIVEGVIRSTFLVDNKGEIIKEWKNIRAKGHVDRILKELSS